jgi:hypothetical protein
VRVGKPLGGLCFVAMMYVVFVPGLAGSNTGGFAKLPRRGRSCVSGGCTIVQYMNHGFGILSVPFLLAAFYTLDTSYSMMMHFLLCFFDCPAFDGRSLV